MLRRAGLITPRQARELERSTVALRVTAAFHAGLAITVVVLVLLVAAFSFGYYYSSHFGTESPQPQATDQNAPRIASSSTPDVHEAYQARMDRLLQELEKVSEQQRALEAKLTNKTSEAAEMASQTQLLRAQLRLREREIQTLSSIPEPEPERKFEMGPTRRRNDNAQIATAMAAAEVPAEIRIDINPPDARPGNPYRLRLEIHNLGDSSIHVTDLELVWNYAGRNTGGRLPFGKRLVGPGSTSVLYEVDGIWMEELTAGEISATVTLEGGAQLVNTLRWNGG